MESVAAQDAKDAKDAKEKSAPDGEAVGAGRGVLYIALAKLYFMVAGASIDFVLPNVLSRFSYGAYGFVNQTVSILNNVMVTGTIQAVSRYTTADPAKADEVKAAGLRMHLLVGLPVAVAFAAGAPLIAHLAHDSDKTGPLVLSAGIVLAYAFYCVFVGSANGTRAFHKQAGLDITASTLRAGGILAAAAIGLGVWGAIGAWVAAAVTVLIVATVVVGVPKDRRAGAVGPMVRYLGGVAVYLVILNLIMAVDQLLLKRLSTEWFHAHGDWLRTHSEWLREHAGATLDAAAKAEADGQVGLYRTVQSLARLPYQLMIAVTFVIFPLVSRSTFEKNAEQTRGYIRTTMKYSLMFAGLMGVVLAARSAGALSIFFRPEYVNAGGPALTFLALGNVAFVVFSIAGTILNGAGRTKEAVIVAAGTLIVLVAGLWIGLPRVEPGRQMLLVCASATAGAMLIGAVASGLLLLRRFGGFIGLLSVARVLLAAAVTLAAGRFMPDRGKIITLAELAACGVIFVGVLVGSGELRPGDLLRRKKA